MAEATMKRRRPLGGDKAGKSEEASSEPVLGVEEEETETEGGYALPPNAGAVDYVLHPYRSEIWLVRVLGVTVMSQSLLCVYGRERRGERSE